MNDDKFLFEKVNDGEDNIDHNEPDDIGYKSSSSEKVLSKVTYEDELPAAERYESSAKLLIVNVLEIKFFFCDDVIESNGAAMLAISSPDERSKSQEEAINEPVNKKRKGMSRKRLKSLIKRMMDTVREKQEQMHKQLIEILGNKENESIMREEA
ncbi:hypothetical protein Tco_1555678 [Tanacetum coccineum]